LNHGARTPDNRYFVLLNPTGQIRDGPDAGSIRNRTTAFEVVASIFVIDRTAKIDDLNINGLKLCPSKISTTAIRGRDSPHLENYLTDGMIPGNRPPFRENLQGLY